MIRLGLVLALAALIGCATPAPPQEQVAPVPLPSTATATSPRTREVSRGQLLYVPVYSHVYLMDGRPYNLAITLSIRNTSLDHKLVVQSVAYYDSAGKLIKDHADKELELGPLATAEYFVREDDSSGGSGANFLVKWVAEQEISDPIVEAVMVGTSGGHGVSFVTNARVLKGLPVEGE
ncbi:MAG: DUF3124 domain-containing protein [Candidatus Eremiobacteraeota bacterium]|nr:DUF3124 domain-containing protein [Candidatus Eremiobacteraeota bacterium]